MTGAAARRRRWLEPAILALHTSPRLSPSARWPFDLPALPPAWAHSVFAVGGGSTTDTPASAGSTFAPSIFDRIGTRLPTVGVTDLSPLPNSPPLQATSPSESASASATRPVVERALAVVIG